MIIYDIQIGDYFISNKDIHGYRGGYDTFIPADERMRILYHYYYNDYLFLRLIHDNGEVFEIDLKDDADFKITSFKKEQRIKKIKSIFA